MYGNRFWKNGIHFVNEVLRSRELPFKVEVGDVVPGVYTGVCPAGSNYGDWGFEEYRKGPLEFGLYAVGIVLTLPSAEMGTIV